MLLRTSSLTIKSKVLGNDANAVYNYDLADRLTKLDNKIGANHIVFDYTYDKAGNRKTMKVDNNSNNTHSYSYDRIYRITEADYPGSAITNYYYDPVGNFRKVDTANYTNNNLNEYTVVGGISYSYDQNGNLTDDGNFKYYYDCENRLTDVNDEGNSRVASYKYDFAGRRISKTVSGVTTKYCYDGDQIIAEYDGSGTLLRKYVYGPGIDEPICMITASGTKYYYHFDGLGSVVALSDSSNNIVERYEYNNVFGGATIEGPNHEPRQASSYDNSYMFTGREWDAETGNYYYRARYYNSDLGRFLQPDPIGYGS